jgi:hypothetical protein
MANFIRTEKSPVKQPGYASNRGEIRKILRKIDTIRLITYLQSIGEKDVLSRIDISLGIELIHELKPLDIAIIIIELWFKEGMHHLHDLLVRADELLLVEITYLHLVLGNSWRTQETMSPEQIQHYEQEWRNIGIEPKLVNYPEFPTQTTTSLNTQDWIFISSLPVETWHGIKFPKAIRISELQDSEGRNESELRISLPFRDAVNIYESQEDVENYLKKTKINHPEMGLIHCKFICLER